MFGRSEKKPLPPALSDEVASIYKSSSLSSLANKYGLAINSVTWEDTARSKNSALGPNISDMTLVTADGHRMPVIRKPNFTDETYDLAIENFNVTVGNERGEDLSRVDLKTYLKNISQYTIRNNTGGVGEEKENTNVKSMLIERDTQILTSAQFCVLPLVDGECEFNVQLFNYQSYNDPAVLVVVASSQGTSTQVVTNGTEKLCINLNGKAANYLAKRLKEDRKEKGKAIEGAMDLEEQERNVLFVYQIPLKRKPPPRTRCIDYSSSFGGTKEVFSKGKSYNSSSASMNIGGSMFSEQLQSLAPPGCGIMSEQCNEESFCEMESASKRSIFSRDGSVKKTKKKGMDNAVLRAGATHSDFKGVGNHILERDENYPIRCTIQFYKVTDSYEIPEEEFQEMRQKIDKVYSSGVATGSLVVSGDTNRVTEPKLPAGDVDLETRTAMPMLHLFV